jgi:hypothetical protein
MLQLHLLWMASKKMNKQFIDIETVTSIVEQNNRSSKSLQRVWRQYLYFQVIEPWLSDILAQMKYMASQVAEGHLVLMKGKVISQLEVGFTMGARFREHMPAIWRWAVQRKLPRNRISPAFSKHFYSQRMGSHYIGEHMSANLTKRYGSAIF